VEQARVLIVSDDAEFVNSLVQSWQRFSAIPEYSVSGLHGVAEFPEGSVAVIDGSEPAAAARAMVRLSGSTVLAVVISGDQPFPSAVCNVARVLQVSRSAGCVDIVAALAQETVLRVEAQQRAGEADHRLRKSARLAALGQFISEARHGLGNALTSVLGNSELVLLDTAEAGLSHEVRGQLETVHAMSLKIHETLRRLSSLDTEMQVAERQAERETQSWPVKAAAPQ
jgi:signal transduction histidine kinase